MKDLKLNISDSAKAAMSVPKAPVPPVSTFVEPKMERMKVSVPPGVNNIANWSLFPEGEGIRAVNNRSGEVYTGTVAEFNSYIRGA